MSAYQTFSDFKDLVTPWITPPSPSMAMSDAEENKVVAIVMDVSVFDTLQCSAL